MLKQFIVILFYSGVNLISNISEPIIEDEGKYSDRIIVKQKFDSKDININIHKLKNSQDHRSFKSCVDPQNNLVYVYTSIINTEHALYVMDLATEVTIMITHNRLAFSFDVEKMYCFGGVLIITMASFQGIWTRFHLDQKTFFHNIPGITGVHINEHDPSILALTSKTKKLYILELKTRKHEIVATSVSKPKWSTKGLYFIESESYVKKLRFFSIEKRAISMIYEEIQDFGYENDILWVFIKSKNFTKLTFKVGKQHFDGMLGETKINEILDLKIRDKIVVVTIKELRKDYLTVWIAETHDFAFTKISDHLLGEDSEDLAFSFHTSYLEYYLDMIDQLPGLIFVSKITRSYFAKPHESTFVSYNYGNTFVPLLYGNDSRSCEWPNCQIYIPPEDNSLFTSFQFAKDYPLIMAGKCVFIEKGTERIPRYMISNDGGYTWKDPIIEFKDMIILNEGEVIIGDHGKLHFSVDMGSKWTELDFQQGSYHTQYMMKGRDAAKYKFLTILLDEKSNDVYLAVIDFDQMFVKRCEDYDFIRFTPGSDKTKSCFHGVRGITYLKHPDKICRSEFKNLPNIDSESCVCTPEDYKCPFEYSYHQGKCYTRLINSKNKHVYECEDPSAFIPSLIKPIKFKNNKCHEDSKQLEVMEICRYNQNHFTVSMIVTRKLMFIDLMDLKRVPTIFSDELQVQMPVSDFKIDKFKKCIYSLIGDGILQKCYGTRKALDHRPLLINQDVRIVGIDYDTSTHYLYFHTKHSVVVMDLKMVIKSTIYTTSHLIYFLKLDLKELKIYISCFENSTKGIEVRVLSMDGTLEKSFKFSEFVTEIDYNQRYFNIYTEKGVFKYFIQNKTTKNIQKPIKYFRYLHVVSHDQFVTNHGFFLKNNFVLYKNIHRANLEVDIYSSLPKSCRFSNCDYFCFPLRNDKFICGCPDPLKYNKRTKMCDCLDPSGECNICQDAEYACHNQKCIMIKYYCDGVDDCGDNSDEQYCTKICDSDELSCTKNNQDICVMKHQICDGIKDCDDGIDELMCDRIIKKCQAKEFECFDERCIPSASVCDGKNDCGDLSDEKNCLERKCEEFGAFCDDGTCIHHRHICDDVFHCNDFSDERACNPRTIFEKNLECLIRCNGSCVPVHQICDHLTHCTNHEDEKYCGFRPICPKSKPMICADDEGCYEKTEKCDGFKDCPDGSDELCQVVIKCFGEEEYTCKNGYRICMSRVCDGINDCPDASDEKEFCQNGNHLNDIRIEKNVMGKVSFAWTHSGGSSEFIIFIHTMGSDKVIEKAISVPNVMIDEHSDCERYLVMVKQNDLIIKYRQYKYLDGGLDYRPFDLNYNPHDQVLSWRTKTPSCISHAFYIECLLSNKISIRNFSLDNNIKLHSDLILVCRVASCPKMVINMSCSRFSDDIYIKHKIFVVDTRILMISGIVIGTIVILLLAFSLKIIIKNRITRFRFRIFSLGNILSRHPKTPRPSVR